MPSLKCLFVEIRVGGDLKRRLLVAAPRGTSWLQGLKVSWDLDPGVHGHLLVGIELVECLERVMVMGMGPFFRLEEILLMHLELGRDHLIDVEVPLEVDRLYRVELPSTSMPLHYLLLFVSLVLDLLVADTTNDAFHFELALGIEYRRVECERVILFDSPYLFA